MVYGKEGHISLEQDSTGFLVAVVLFAALGSITMIDRIVGNFT